MTQLEQRPSSAAETVSSLSPFVQRHVGPSEADQQTMLESLGFADLDAFVSAVVPGAILDAAPPVESMPLGCGEAEALAELRVIGSRNRVRRSLIGLGYHDTATPALIKRHVLENPAWYTAYTPYQAEIAQGRLEALLNFQTLISELTGLPIANASLLDEATACAEAMGLSLAVCTRPEAKRFLVDAAVLPQTVAVLQTRAEPLGVVIDVAEPEAFRWDQDVFGMLLQLPGRCGRLWDPTAVIAQAHAHQALATVAVDPFAQVLLARWVSWGPTSPWAVPSVSVFPWGAVVPMLLFSQPVKPSSVRCRDGSSVSPAMRKGGQRCGSPFRPVSSTSDGTRPRATFAPPRCCWR